MPWTVDRNVSPRNETLHRFRRWGGLTSLFLLAPATLSAQTPISRALPAGVRVIADVRYARYGSRELKLDLYLPEASATKSLHPVVVIRGGGWRRGDKEGFGPMAAALAVRGIPAVSIEYRASDEALFPAAVHDTKAAVRWLRANGTTHGLDPERIGAIGGSAGAHLATYLGVTWDIEELEGDGGSEGHSSRVQAVVGLATPADFVPDSQLAREPESRSTTPAPVSGREAFLGVAFSADPERWKLASPVHHVDAESPPILLVHSEDDRTVHPRQSLRLAERYADAGVPVEVVMFPGAPHAFWNAEEWFADTMDRAAAFFLRHLGARQSGSRP